MLNIVKKFPEQTKDSLKIKTDFSFEDIKNIAVAGMGGSAISADILKHFSRLPFLIIRDYDIPPFLNENTLFIGISYSGNTKETFSCFEDAKKVCQTLAITSGGKLGKIALSKIVVPKGMQPRAAIAYLLFPLAKFLSDNDLLIDVNVENAIYTLQNDKPKLEKLAEDIAREIKGVPIIYGYKILGSIARRWRQQMNENAKTCAFDFSLPECNHNELEAWERDVGDITCIFLRDTHETPDIEKRFEFMKDTYGEKAHVIEVFSSGEDKFAGAISLLFLGDLVSLHMANIYGVEAEPVNLIERLKGKMNQHSRSSS